MWKWIMKKALRRELERESFNARITMEERSQREVAARLRAVELKVKNEAHLR